MRVHRLLHQLVMKFSAMDESEASSLNSEAETAYKEALQQAQAKVISNDKRTKEIAENIGNKDYKPREVEKLTIQDRCVMFCEKWYSKYGFAILYIILVPIIRDYINGEAEDTEQGNNTEMMELLSLYEKLRHYKNK